MNRRKVQNRFLNYIITNSSQVYKVFVATYCECTEKGDIEFKNETLKLIHHGVWKFSEDIKKINDSISNVTEIRIEEVLQCDGAYELRYDTSGLKTQPKFVSLNDEIITNTERKYKLRRIASKFEIVNKDTINLIDIYGLKQKTYFTFRPDGKLLSKIYDDDSQPISGLAKARYSTNGFDRRDMYMENGNDTKRNYYKYGKLFKTCDTEGAFGDNTNCIFTE